MGQGVMAKVKPKAVEFEAKVIRCGCADDEERWAKHPVLTVPVTGLGGHEIAGLTQAQLGPCPNPKKTEDLGVIAAYYRNPFKRLLWALSQRIKHKRGNVQIGDRTH